MIGFLPLRSHFSRNKQVCNYTGEINNYGVFGNKYRQEIYEKTRNLLFNGSKAVMGKIWTGEEKCKDMQPTEQTTLLRGQTQIGHDGRLTRTNTAQGAPVTSTRCCVCQKSQGSRTQCFQCDRLPCASCTRQCSRCSSLCCSVCTIIDYSGPYDEVVCCGCST
ncbi:hypothetical protein Q5P01_020416 [Channa striata]|uniref:Apoptosis regulatory protein Siva n=1 Tax=Channa striata TaxID=64152 RepID=A0AA88LXP2_CHASR|nr:hypothetical protein Q5P01_020416 [Channa striata]